ncbi:MAG: hypothetical protein QOG23_1477 [Blastocatellia bacterium]|jgi:hypothetical protein|nr:hypothetical protein [Blastocatellia bacterium]
MFRSFDLKKRPRVYRDFVPNGTAGQLACLLKRALAMNVECMTRSLPLPVL